MPQLCDFINKLVHSIGINDQPAAKTVADLAAHAPSNITILTNALNRAGLQTVIGNPDWKATIFAPTNQVHHLHEMVPASMCTNLMNFVNYTHQSRRGGEETIFFPSTKGGRNSLQGEL